MTTDTDALTGLPDHGALERHLAFSIEAEPAVALALADVDGFGRVNAELGPGVGDHVLVELARLLDEAATGAAYRVSADEFAVLLPNASLEQAFLRMEGLRARVQGEQERFGLPEGWRAAISVGVAQFPRDGKNAGEVQNAAAAALRGAKESGGNQVALPPNEPMVMKSSYYPASLLADLKALAERLKVKESELLREALNDLLRKHQRSPAQATWRAFTDMAKRAVFFAQQEAGRFRVDKVNPEHLLLGLLHEQMSTSRGPAVSTRVLQRLGADPAALRAELERDMVPGGAQAGADKTLAVRSRRALDLAYEEARRLNNKHIGSEHILLGILREGGPAARQLASHGIELDAYRREAVAFLTELTEGVLYPDGGAGLPPDAAARPPELLREALKELPQKYSIAGDPWHSFTDKAKRAVHLAQQEAGRVKSDKVDPEHLLLALIHDAASMAGPSASVLMLERLGIDVAVVAAELEQDVAPDAQAPEVELSLSQRARQVLDLAYEEAHRRSHKHLGTEHLLTGILREGGQAARALSARGVEPGSFWREVQTYMEEGTDVRAPEPLADPEEERIRAEAAELGVNYVDLAKTQINEDAVRRVPRALAERLGVVAVEQIGGRLFVAMKQPVNAAHIEELRAATGLEVVAALARHSAVDEAIPRFYGSEATTGGGEPDAGTPGEE